MFYYSLHHTAEYHYHLKRQMQYIRETSIRETSIRETSIREKNHQIYTNRCRKNGKIENKKNITTAAPNRNTSLEEECVKIEIKLKTETENTPNTLKTNNMSQQNKNNSNVAIASMLKKMEGEPNRFNDKYGCTWVQETNTGYRRLSDNFFIKNMNSYNHNNHSETVQQNMKNQIKVDCLEAQKNCKN